MKITNYILIITLLTSSILCAESVKVEEQIAITKPFTKKVKIGEKCYEHTVETTIDCDGNQETNSIGFDTIIGSVLGVVIGNQIGNGSGKDAAKIVGGLSGGYIANQQRNNQKCTSYREVTKCDPIYEYRTEKVTVGYKNCATFKGQRVCKERKEPLDFLEVTQKIYIH